MASEYVDQNWVKKQFVNFYKKVIENKFQPIQYGKGLSECDFTKEDKALLSNCKPYDDSELKNEIKALKDTTELEEKINGKVDKVDGFTLSSNNFTNEYKNKLDSIQNYNDAALWQQINSLKSELDKLRRENETLRRGQIKSVSQKDTKLVFKFNNDTEADIDLTPIMRAICG